MTIQTTQAAGAVPQAPVQPARVSRIAVVTTSLALTMAVLDGSIANLALPSIARDLSVTPSDVIWVVNAYQIAVLILLLPLGSLGEILGFRTIYRAGLVVFTLASLACALSPNLAWLSVARVFQGAGAAGIMSVNAGLLRFIYPPGKLGQGLGINALVVALSSAVGPTVAAGLLAIGPWQLLFFVNLPIGLVTIFLGRTALPETPRSARRFDLGSALLNAAALGLFVLAIDAGGRQTSVPLLVLTLGGAALAVFFLVRRQRGRAAPLLPIDLLKIPLLRLSLISSVTAFSGQTIAFVALPFLLEQSRGLSTTATGLLITTWPLALAIVAPIAGRLTDRYSPGLLGAIGMAIMSIGLYALAATPASAGPIGLGCRLAVCGVGFGLFQTPNNRAILGSAPRERSGGAGGLLSTARLLGNAAGAAGAAVAMASGAHYGPNAAVLAGAVLATIATVVSMTRIGVSSAAAR